MTTFWMVFVEGASSPKKQHETVESAQMEAERLAKSNIGRWFESKMHEECFEEMCNEGDGEYTTYSNDRPQRADTVPNAELTGGPAVWPVPVERPVGREEE